MKVVKLKGGLGNQMFQYAFAKLIEKRTQEEVKIDMSAFDGLENDPIRQPRIKEFCLSLQSASKKELNDICLFQHNSNSKSIQYRLGLILENSLNRRYYFEVDRAYRDPQKLLKYSYFDGYWQSWKYIDEVWNDLKMDFTPNYQLSEQTQLLINKMKDENSVFIGVRKGDYSKNANHFGVYGQEYYENAIKIIEQRVSDPVYYVFSNDIPWTKTNLNFGKRTTIYREPDDIVDDFDELLLMANCKHSIMLNSTYHWWGSRLNDSKDKIVVVPQYWFMDGKLIDIIPSHWVRV